ncbi:hypothetical protein OEZ86_013542 [Tetradesmus obliquus]|nr:hypothetical protein OEZ86_013542 [Tetradesmus obliquus]
MQYMLVLPLPLHLACSTCEWLLIYSTDLRLAAAAAHPATNSAAAATAAEGPAQQAFLCTAAWRLQCRQASRCTPPTATCPSLRPPWPVA